MIQFVFSAWLAKRLDADSNYLPLSTADNAKLVSLLPEGEETYLSIKDDAGKFEIVKATNECGTIVIDRAQGVTTAVTFPPGSCVFFDYSGPVIEWLICNHNCCDGECPCESVAAGGVTSPDAVVGRVWMGMAVFTGDTPMTIGVQNQPSWMTVEVGANYVRLTGTPPIASTWDIIVTATNCSGAAVTAQTMTVVATA